MTFKPSIFNYNLETLASEKREDYTLASPFKHIIIENFLNPEFLDSILTEFPNFSEIEHFKYNNGNELKFASKGSLDFGPSTQQLAHQLNSEEFLRFLNSLTNIKEPLFGDPYLLGGGFHEIRKKGLLKIHADFNKHLISNLDRRINVLVYLNKDWKDDFGGALELWNSDMTLCVKKIAPQFNRAVIFSTDDFSFHGHPDPLNCPDNISRKSLAFYYYSNGRPLEEIISINDNHSTLFKSRKNHPDEVIKHKNENAFLFRKKVQNIMPPFIFNWIRNTYRLFNKENTQ